MIELILFLTLFFGRGPATHNHVVNVPVSDDNCCVAGKIPPVRVSWQ